MMRRPSSTVRMNRAFSILRDPVLTVCPPPAELYGGRRVPRRA
jgi:hypothetical protein